jgi:hypothetical protein
VAANGSFKNLKKDIGSRFRLNACQLNEFDAGGASHEETARCSGSAGQNDANDPTMTSLMALFD